MAAPVSPLVAKMLTECLGKCAVEDRLAPDAKLVEDLGADSLDFIELQMMLEDQGFVAPDAAFTNHMTIADLERLAQPAPAQDGGAVSC